jgi:hypothetical protein
VLDDVRDDFHHPKYLCCRKSDFIDCVRLYIRMSRHSSDWQHILVKPITTSSSAPEKLLSSANQDAVSLTDEGQSDNPTI